MALVRRRPLRSTPPRISADAAGRSRYPEFTIRLPRLPEHAVVLLPARPRLLFVAAGLALAGCLAAYFLWLRHGADSGPAARSFDGDSGQLRRTVIVPTLDTPIPEGE